MSSPQQSPDTAGQADRSGGSSADVVVPIGIQAVGALLVLLPLHWLVHVVGFVLIGFGTLAFSMAWNTRAVSQHPERSPERMRCRRNGFVALNYGVVLIAIAILVAVSDPSSRVRGIVNAIAAVVPVVLGLRLLVAAGGSESAQTVRHTTCRAITVIFFVVALLIGPLSGTGWDLALLAVPLFGLILLYRGVSGLPAPRTLRIACAVGLFALALAGMLGGRPGWLAVAGSDPVRCQVLDANWQDSTRSPNFYTYTVQCGGQRLEYDPIGFAGPFGSDLQLVTDRSGVGGPLHVTEVPGARGAVYLGIVGISGVLLVLALIPWRTRRP
ncbi:hypothetical protein E1161_07115 [Saccharopolyspora aridisoli]|uniref:Uncharacterized protein n=1 Tax=Saccharopolyspora aridisoli TaxID=2530385 RepID=A0A4R4URA2_9PSEU|nr:hypothetical protein [Saccharopolyspora aridisoli]TDC94807.1 hypothetical protein E1161_07115 [Saccharopolyspora aridisoli]